MTGKQASLGRAWLLAMSLGIGLGLAWAVVIGFVSSALATPFARASTWKTVAITAAGEARLEIHHRDGRTEATTLDGQPAERLANHDRWLSPTELRLPNPYYGYPDWSQRLKSATDGGANPTYWYLIHDGNRVGRMWLEGYDSVSRQRVGILDRQGFHSGQGMPVEPFTIPWSLWTNRDTWNRNYYYYGRAGIPSGQTGPLTPLDRTFFVPEGQTVWAIDLAERTVARFGDFPETVTAVATSANFNGRVPSATGAVMIGQAGHFLKADYPPSATAAGTAPKTERIDLPQPAIGAQVLYYGPLSGSEENASGGLLVEPSDRREIQRITWLDRQNRVVRQATADVRSPDTSPWWFEPAANVVRGVLCPSLAVQLPITVFEESRPYLQRGEAETWSAAALLAVKKVWPLWVVCAAASLAAAAWVAQRSEAYRLPVGHRVVWIVSAVVFGPQMAAGFALHRPWPARATLDPIPAPEPTGVEVFA